MAVVTQADRLKSVRNRCVIDFLVAFLSCHDAFGFFCRCRGFFFVRTESDLFLFLYVISHVCLFHSYSALQFQVAVRVAERSKKLGLHSNGMEICWFKSHLRHILSFDFYAPVLN